jgi:hypothetical protein
MLYCYNKPNRWDFQAYSDALLNSTTPTLLLFRHFNAIDHSYHTFGFYSSGLWKTAPEITGDGFSSIFSIVPRYK